jgi:meso-butanediol dehydrogenase/(S,S)-butanediol dehydrogenase/diacetyl reductase
MRERATNEHGGEKADMKLKGKTVLITGGGTGIGAAITERFVAEGARVCITGRRGEKLEQEAAAFSGECVVTCPGDVSSHDDVKRMVAAATSLGGQIDILVNNAAIDVVGPITELELDAWRRVVEVNLTGPFLLMKETIPQMIRNGGGSIINIASIGALRCMPGAPAYGASKAGLVFLTQQAALEYGPMGIRCNVVCPGATRTEEWGRMSTESSRDSRRTCHFEGYRRRAKWPASALSLRVTTHPS